MSPSRLDFALCEASDYAQRRNELNGLKFGMTSPNGWGEPVMQFAAWHALGGLCDFSGD
jgi:hypothetical protein